MDGKHPARVFRGELAYLVELLKFLAAELYVYRGKVVLELIGTLGADDNRSDGRLM